MVPLQSFASSPLKISNKNNKIQTIETKTQNPHNKQTNKQTKKHLILSHEKSHLLTPNSCVKFSTTGYFSGFLNCATCYAIDECGFLLSPSNLI
ncbi:hypothetical protein LguiA_025013 [Lonicera macranthoides]